MYFRSRLVPGLVRNGKFLPAFSPAARQNISSACGGHTLPEPVLVLSFPVGWLECTFHDCLSFLRECKISHFFKKTTDFDKKKGSENQSEMG